MNVLIGTDGSPSATKSLELAATINWPARTHIVVLHVDQLLDSDLGLPVDRYPSVHARIREQIDAQLAAAKRTLAAPGRDIEIALVPGRPASAIVAEARRVTADLVILGSHGRGPFASAVLGSVAAEVVDHAPCPVLVARRTTLGSVVLGHDGSDSARQAEQLIADWPFLRASAVRVISVAGYLPAYATMEGPTDAALYQQFIDDLRAEAEHGATDAVARLRALGVTATMEVRDGGDAAELVRAAGEGRADLIVIGSRGRGGLERLLLGSVARNVLFHAPCSVLIVRQKVSIPRQ
jgi:nucleotide-binding universal stress UspA family protein